MISATRSESGVDSGPEATVRISTSACFDVSEFSAGIPAAWLRPLEQGLRHTPYLMEAFEGEERVGYLPLALVQSRLFGRFLVSLPYLNTAGVVAESGAVADTLIEEAARLADALDVRYLELRHEQPWEHPRLTHRLTSKVHMRLSLPNSADQLWKQLKSKVRNQVTSGQKRELTVAWGGQELLGHFYSVFSHNMRDLGTPVYPLGLFRAILDQFVEKSELCVVYQGGIPLAAALLVHGREGVTQVPSASSLREYNFTNANMLMYWELLRRAMEHNQKTFDFGRSTIDSNTYRFKKQWGAEPVPAAWQYYVRHGDVGDMRPENARYRRLIRIWQKLPLGLTRLLGPTIARGIP